MVLRALILVGGYGTRLRPLTFSKPKPLVEFVNKPTVLHQIEALVDVGVKEIILAVSHMSNILENELSHIAHKLKIKIIFSLEKEPLGTAGPIALAKTFLDVDDADPFFMLNADVIANYRFDLLLQYHQSHGKEGSIYVTEVKDPSRYGVVVADDNGKINAFVEKPKELKYGNKINAGMYIFNKSIIKRISPQPTSIEIDIFPIMAKEENLYRLTLNGYWMDVGKPSDFISGQSMFLNAMSQNNDERLFTNSERIIGNVVIHPTSKVSLSAMIGPNVVIGPNCEIKASARIKNSVIFNGSTINEGSYIEGSIVGWRSSVGKWSRLQNLCILGEDVSVKDEICLIGTIVCPNKSVKEDHFKLEEILM